MSKGKELAKNTLILTFGKICTQFVSFMLLPLYTALLQPDEFGIVDLFNTYITLLVPIFNWQFENGLFRFMLDCRGNKEEQSKIFSTVLFTNMIQALVYILFFLIFQNFISSEYKIFLAIDVVLNIFLNTLLQFPRGLGNSKAYAIGSFISASSAVAFNVVLIAGFGMGAYGMFIAAVISKVLTISYLFISQKAWRYISLKRYDKKEFKNICKYSIPLIPNQLSWWVVGASDRTIIAHFIDLAANGIYTVANKFSSVFITFYNIFNMSWTESVSIHMNDDDCEEFLTDTINSMFKLFSSICIGIIAAMPFLFPYFVDAKYSDSYQQIPILMIAVLFQVVVGLYSVIYVALKKSVEIAKTSFMAALVNIVTNLLMIQFIGLYAASVSTLLAYATMAIYRYFHVKKYINLKLSGKILLSTIAIAGVTLAAYYYRNMIICGVVLAGVAVYAVLINKDFLKSTLQVVKNKFKAVTHKK
ncbi:MAG: oligosaccharide flippase family protein [Ruminococcus sp.]|nr:oligosaccharide flippase family protein [Ruminococcus sp.]